MTKTANQKLKEGRNAEFPGMSYIRFDGEQATPILTLLLFFSLLSFNIHHHRPPYDEHQPTTTVMDAQPPPYESSDSVVPKNVSGDVIELANAGGSPDPLEAHQVKDMREEHVNETVEAEVPCALGEAANAGRAESLRVEGNGLAYVDDVEHVRADDGAELVRTSDGADRSSIEHLGLVLSDVQEDGAPRHIQGADEASDGREVRCPERHEPTQGHNEESERVFRSDPDQANVGNEDSNCKLNDGFASLEELLVCLVYHNILDVFDAFYD